MFNPLLNLGGTGGIRAVIHNFAFGFNHLSPTHRACRLTLLTFRQLVKETKYLFFASAFTFYRTDHLRYHLTGPLHHNGITDADVLASNVVLIV